MKFRPCIDIHEGKVKQVVGSTLVDGDAASLATNFISDRPASWFASLYRKDALEGGHVIQLGAGNERQAQEALSAWPDALQIGGGITEQNAAFWLDCGAEKAIVTSYVFRDGEIYDEGLTRLNRLIGRERLVLDVSCRKKNGKYWIVTDRWQKFTKTELSIETLQYLSRFCSEFLVHAVDAEGKCNGIEREVVALLGKWHEIPVAYAGGIRSWDDIKRIRDIGAGRVDFTVGSALDIFGGTGLQYKELVRCHRDGFKAI